MSALSKPVTTLPATEAAQQLRILLHTLALNAENGTVTIDRYDEEGEPDPEGWYDKDGNELSSSQIQGTPMWMNLNIKNNITTRCHTLEAQLHALTVTIDAMSKAIESRKVIEGRAVLKLLKEHHYLLDDQRRRIAAEVRYIATTATDLKLLLGGNQTPADQLRRAYELAQCLPTVENIPTDPAENTIRAICALLRNHQVPGSESLTQAVEKKEVNNATGEHVEEADDLTEVLDSFATSSNQTTVTFGGTILSGTSV